MLRSPVASTAAPGRCRPRREVSPGRHVCGSRSAASPPAPARPRAGRSSERFQRSQHILQQHWIDPSGYPHPGSRELDLDRRCPSDVALFRHHRWDEIERRRPPGFRRSVCRLAQLLAPRIQLVAMQPVAARDRTRHRVRSQALGDDLRLLLPAPPPPPLRPRQHLAAARALPTNWQLTWQTIHLRLPLRETPSSARRHCLQRAVKASLTHDPFSGTIYVFRCKRADRRPSITSESDWRVRIDAGTLFAMGCLLAGAGSLRRRFAKPQQGCTPTKFSSKLRTSPNANALTGNDKQIASKITAR